MPTPYCWPQACLSDWAAYEPTVWLATLAVGLAATALAISPLALVVWLTRRRA
jgi:hypothetical protein